MKLYRTRTQEEYDWLMKELETVGYKWNSGEYATESKVEDENKGNIVVYVEEGEPLTFDYVKDVDAEELKSIIEVSELMKEQDPLAKKVEERNSKPTIQDRLPEELERLLADEPRDPIKPDHYRKGEIDLYESWYRTYPFNEFRAIMSAIAERYMKRDKENRIEDLDKAIYTLTRLKEYEEMEEE